MKRRQVKRAYQFTSLNESGEDPVVKREKKTIPKRNWWRGVRRYGLYAIAVVIIGYLVFFSNLFQINNISVQGPNTALSQDLKKGTEQYLDSRLLGRNWLLLNTQDLRNILQKSFSGQESISVDKIFPAKLVIKTDEQKPGLIWKTSSHRYIVSINGRIMSELQHDQQSSLVMLVDTSNIPVEVGDNVAGRQFVSFTTFVSDYLKINNLGPSELYIRDTTSELLAQTSAGYLIKFDTTANPQDQTRQLQAVLDYLKSQNKKPNEYIDLRISNKVFYK